MDTVETYQGLHLTERAAAHVKQYLEREGGKALRVGVKRTGCSGWAYTVDIAQGPSDDDQVFTDRGLQIVVDVKALELIDGTKVDFVTEGLNRLFTFSNPNVHEECGCGESFSVREA